MEEEEEAVPTPAPQREFSRAGLSLNSLTLSRHEERVPREEAALVVAA